MREWIHFERKLGRYDLAGAQYSYGDVFSFVERAKKGIVLVDTCGHVPEKGKRMKQFLENIQRWQGSNAAEDLQTLEQRLLQIKPEGWNEWVSALYVQMVNNEFSIAKAGGIPNPLILREDGSYKEILLPPSKPFDHEFPKIQREMYFNCLEKGNVLCLYSDGFLAPFFELTRRYSKKDWNRVIHEDMYQYLNLFVRPLSRPLPEIRNIIVEETKKGMRNNEREDDITLMLVKLTSDS